MVIRGTSLILLCKIVITLASDGDFATVDEDVKAQLQKLREDVTLLKESYRRIVIDVADKRRDELRNQEKEIQDLKKIVAKLEERVKYCEESSKVPVVQERLSSYNAVIARTCEELKASNVSLESGMYWIDPDGHNTGDAPIHVFCNMTTGSTSILHDSESPIEVHQCWDAGCYNRPVNYKASARQITAVIELSSVCAQNIKYECRMAPMEFNSVPQSWWTDRHGNRRYDFTGGNSSTSKCQCAINKSCLDRELQCNCNALSPTDTVDTGAITDKTLLPVKALNFGRVLAQPAFGKHTLSRLECYGRVLPTNPNRPPSSCQDLWRMGHTLSGYYTVQHANTFATVFCDMMQIPGQGKTTLAFATTEQLGATTSRLNEMDNNVEKQFVHISGLQSSLNRLASVLSRHNRTINSKLQKLGEKDGKLSQELMGLTANQQKQMTSISELKKQMDRPRGISINRMPKSCADLRVIGHALSGIYPVKGSGDIEMIYCDMTSTIPVETWIGKANVKSSSVYFYVQRKSPFYIEGKGRFSSVLPFDVTRSNEGGGMDAKSGVFTAPRDGTYVFAFGAIKAQKARHVVVYLRLNDSNRVASVYGSEHEGYLTLSLQSILKLKQNDKVQLVMESTTGGGIYDDNDMTTYFSGFLLEEQLFT